jgi:hypothetical protein
MKKTTASFQIDKATWLHFKISAIEADVSASKLMRRLIRQHLEQHPTPTIQQLREMETHAN